MAPAPAPRDPSPEHGMVSGSAGFLGLSASRIAPCRWRWTIFHEIPTGCCSICSRWPKSSPEQNASDSHRCRPSAILFWAEHDAAQAEIEKLRLLIRQLQRGQFGRRSEKLDPDQLQLGLEDLEQTVAAAEAAQEEAAARSSTPRPPRVAPAQPGRPAGAPAAGRGPGRHRGQELPLLRRGLHVIGEDTSEMLDIVPAQLRVKVIRRPRYGCRACEGAVVQAPAPERPITGGMATEALLAHVLVAKYADFLPFYRQAQSSPGKGSSSTARPCATGSGGPAGGWSRCGACCAGTS